MICSVLFIHIKTSSTEEVMIAFTRAIAALHKSVVRNGSDMSMLVLGLYQHVSEPSQKWLSKAFIERSVMPYQRLSKRHLLFEFAEKIKK